MPWKPTAHLETLKFRSQVIQHIRQFFAERSVLEVDTPLLGASTASDPHISSFQLAHYPLYLQTSPEFPMKRLLAAGSGCIYQISKALRMDERGRHHEPEFTMLEWYRLGFDHHQLMNEVDGLLQCILHTPEGTRVGYGDLFQAYLGIDPHTCSIDILEQCAERQNIVPEGSKSEPRLPPHPPLSGHLLPQGRRE